MNTDAGMTIRLRLTPETYGKLALEAVRMQMTTEEWAVRLLENAVSDLDPMPPPRRRF